MGAKYSKNSKGRIEEYWDIGKKLGQGSFGTVRKCVRKKDKKEAAVKIIRKRDLNKKELKTLDREAEILTKANHTNCVRLYDIFDTKHHLYLVMELCTGGELFDAICENNFSERDAAKVVKEITEALIYLHDQGIVHRDLKPENLLYSTKEKKHIKLMDFGLAKALDGDDEALETRCGTLHYVAPEVLSKNPYTNACDFWSLGVVLYVLLCGYLPFYHEERAITVQLVRKGKFDFDDEEWKDISDNAKDLIRRLLEIDVNKRITGPQILQHAFIKDNPGSVREPANAKKFQQNLQKVNEQRDNEKVHALLAGALYQVYLKRWQTEAANASTQQTFE